MHAPEVRQKFVELRARGWSLARIAAELGVARSTLIEWSRQLRFDIQNQLAIELDDLQNRLLGPRQHRATVLAEKLSAIEAELKKRDLASLSTMQLHTLAQLLQRQILRETEGHKFVSPVKDIPDKEYVEQIQEWLP
jgi:transcriptional regulator with XRE-family HTH domain